MRSVNEDSRNASLGDFIENIHSGDIQIPQFQRDFVWQNKDSIALLHSILKGYPIGPFILWETTEKLATIKIENNILPPNTSGKFSYILDGQQRITTIYCAVKGIPAPSNKKNRDFSNIKINLEKDINDDEVIEFTEENDPSKYISFKELCDGDNISFSNRINDKYKEKKALDYQSKLLHYRVTLISIKSQSIVVATEVFTQINIRGKVLGIFEIMAARTYEEGEFDLVRKWKEVKAKDLGTGYRKIKADIILQGMALATSTSKKCNRKDILNIPKETFIEKWKEITEVLKETIDYFKKRYLIASAEIVPYSALYVLFMYFFYNNGKQDLSPRAKTHLDEFFWRAAFSERYAYSAQSKASIDVATIELVGDPKFEIKFGDDVEGNIDIREEKYQKNSAYSNAVLCILAYEKPLEFFSPDYIFTNNDSLTKDNFSEIHHIFPKAYLKKISPSIEVDLIGNITFLDNKTNGEIAAKPPHKYLLERGNIQEVRANLKSHFIDLEGDGLKTHIVTEKVYLNFIKNRCKRIERAIRERIPSLRKNLNN